MYRNELCNRGSGTRSRMHAACLKIADRMQGADFICRTLRPPNSPRRFGSQTDLISDLLMCQAADPTNEPMTMPVLLEDTLIEHMPDLREMDNAAEVVRRPIVRECMDETRVLTRLQGAANCAQPSPCGQWVAVLTDSMTVTLLPEALDYRLRCSMLLKWPDVGLCAPSKIFSRRQLLVL